MFTLVQVELILLFFVVAFIYSSVGFGGGSSYLALLALFGIDYLSLRLIALLCNITVVTGSVFVFWKQGLIPWKKTLPLVVLSIPAAFLGGTIQLEERHFFIVLGVVLLLASVAMFFQPSASQAEVNHKQDGIKSPLIGGAIGFLSGLVGIGGGIFLSPTLHLLRWDKALRIAAVASIYILANSIAGLVGQMKHVSTELIQLPFVLSLVAAVLIGGQLGVRVGIFKFDAKKLKRVTAILVLLVAVRILIKYSVA